MAQRSHDQRRIRTDIENYATNVNKHRTLGQGVHV